MCSSATSQAAPCPDVGVATGESAVGVPAAGTMAEAVDCVVADSPTPTPPDTVEHPVRATSTSLQ